MPAIGVGTYSFTDVLANLVGPGGSINLGSGAGATEEGISVEYKDDKNIQTTGADGSVMNSLNASKSGRVIVRILKTSPVNAQLSQMYNLQSQTSANWGTNVISIRNPISGDSITATYAAFKKHSPITYDRDGRHCEWEFDAMLDVTLGGGLLTNLATFGAGSV
jgi:hypothetical protein